MSATQTSQHGKITETVLKFQYPDTPASLLPSSYPQGLIDRTTVDAQLSVCDSVISFLEDELHNNDTTATTAEVHERISAYRKYRDFQRYLISSVCNIPDETLSRIFSYVYIGCLHIFGNGSSDFWNVLRVCVRWRNVAQSIPSFWNKFSIGDFEVNETSSEPGDDSDSDNNSDSESIPLILLMCRLRVLMCLENSRTAPLDISILPPSDATASLFKAIMAHLASHCDRWESLEIDGGLVDKYDNKLNLDEVTLLVETRGLPKLRKLVYDGQSADPQGINFYDLFRGAMALEELHLRYTYNYPNCDSGKFPWNNLRKITFTGCHDYEDFKCIFGDRSALRDTPLLEELILDGCYIFIYEGDSEIRFPALHTLCLCLYESDRIEDSPFFPLMQVPKLTSLKVGGDVQDTSEIDRLLEVIDDSGCNVKCLELGLESESDSVEVAVQILEGLHLVEELKLISAPGYIGSLLEHLESNDLIPSLTKLIVQPKDISKDADVDLASTLIDFVRSRENATLAQVTLSITSTNQDKFESSIRQLKKIGKETGVIVEIG